MRQMFWTGVAVAALGGISGVVGFVEIARRRPARFAFRAISGALLLGIGVALSGVSVGMNGYRALTHEDLAARIQVTPLEPQRFEAKVLIPDRPPLVYQIAGDAIYVDARILKWTANANLIGLNSAYELDRVAGRYNDIAQERAAARTVYALSEEKRVDLFALRRRFAMLSPFFDAEYGSGSFVPVSKPATFEVRVSTTGLLIREVEP